MSEASGAQAEQKATGPMIPSLSVIVLAIGPSPGLATAMSAIAPHAARLRAEVVLVADRRVEGVAAAACAQAGAAIVECPTGASRAEASDLGWTRAGADVVAIREVEMVGDGSFLSCFAGPEARPRAAGGALTADSEALAAGQPSSGGTAVPPVRPVPPGTASPARRQPEGRGRQATV